MTIINRIARLDRTDPMRVQSATVRVQSLTVSVSDSEGDELETDEEADLLASHGNNSDDSDDGFQLV